VGDLAVLNKLSAGLHDEWFDLDRLIHDVDRSEVRVTIYPGLVSGRFIQRVTPPFRLPELPTPIGELIVRRVLSLRIEDDAQIGWYDIGDIRFDPTTRRVTLRSNFPCEVAIEVERLDLEFLRP